MNPTETLTHEHYFRALAVSKIMGVEPGVALRIVEDIAAGHCESADNLGISITEASLVLSGLTPLRYFMSRTRYLDSWEKQGKVEVGR